jgi:GNAT superfamily N-acetyltransferase
MPDLTDRGALRAWDGVFDDGVDCSFTVLLSTEVSPWSMIEHPGLERWSVELHVEDCAASADRWAVAAELEMVRADLQEARSFGYSVCETAFGLEQVVEDIQQSGVEPKRVLLVRMAVVDDFWRGRGLGPALVWQTARRLHCSFVALEPAAFDSSVLAGQCVVTDRVPSADRHAQERVRQAWQCGGFQPLTTTTWFANPDDVMAPYLASVHLLDEASAFLATADADRWLTQRDEGRRTGRRPLVVPPAPRPNRRA